MRMRRSRVFYLLPGLVAFTLISPNLPILASRAKGVTISSSAEVIAPLAEEEKIDDFTTHSFSSPSVGFGNFLESAFSRKFSKPIKTIKVTIVAGQADDIGFVGNIRVTDIPSPCSRVGAVTTPVDVTSEVTVTGDTASLVLRAQENCCCFTGWGSSTEFGRQDATLHWEVTLQGDEGCEHDAPKFSQGGAASWAGDLYDHSTTKTIKNKGCALTSLAMALNFAGNDTDPGELNTFMKENDGFEGLSVKWDVTVRNVSGGALRYVPVANSPQELEKALCETGFPVIVGVKRCIDSKGKPAFPCHFVLVTGKQGDKFLINDPGNAQNTTLDAYDNDFVTRGYVTGAGSGANRLNLAAVVADASPDDISGLDLAAGENVEILVTDPAARRTGFDAVTGGVLREIPESAYFVDALEDDPDVITSSDLGHLCEIFQPLQGVYRVNLIGISLGTYSLSVNPFSKDGNAQPALLINGISGAGSTSTFEIQFASDPGSVSSVTRVATLQTTLADIDNSLQLGLIDNHGIAHALSTKIESAAEAASRGEFETAINNLRAFKHQVDALAGRHITGAAVSVLLEDADSLILQLTQ